MLRVEAPEGWRGGACPCLGSLHSLPCPHLGAPTPPASTPVPCAVPCRAQAAKLEAALQPLQEYLDSDLVGELMAADAAPQQQVALEQRLEAQAQAHAAAAEETAAADAQHSQLLHAQPQDSGSPQLNGHANGSVPLAGSAATPARTSMPWH